MEKYRTRRKNSWSSVAPVLLYTISITIFLALAEKMSFRGGGRGGGGRGGFGRGGPGGRGGRGGRGGFDDGPPAEVCEIGVFMHGCEGELVCRLTNASIPYFNAGIYLENGTSKIGGIFRHHYILYHF